MISPSKAGVDPTLPSGNPTSLTTTLRPRDQRKLIRTAAGLEPYAGAWDESTAAHLLRRTMLGPRRSEILSAAAGGLDSTLSQLLAPQSTPPIPPDPNVPGRDWVSGPFSDISQVNYQYDLATKQWWLGLMVTQGISVRERMILFWHNHFSTEAEVVRDARFMYRQNALFRQFAFGNIRELVKAVTIDAAMLRYLNGYLNRVPTPDENYARELQELFTIGKGPQIADGNYTNYTEDDVKAAARVLTGWTVSSYSDPPIPRFVQRNHDPDDKQFSAAYQNTVIGVTRNPDGTIDGYKEMSDLIDMIFRQPETARFLCRKLYRWFVYYEIDETVEQNIIIPLADILRLNDYELKPVLETLFRSAHFFDPTNVGCIIKNPVDLVVGSVRRLGLAPPDQSSPEFASLMGSLADTAQSLQMKILDPPDVAGWPAYYQIPDFHELWINTTTLPLRGKFTDGLVDGFRPRGSTSPSRIDVMGYANTLSNPASPFQLVNDMAADFLSPIQNGSPITPEQNEYLLYSVLGLVRSDEYEWTDNWVKAREDPPDTTALNFVTVRLRILIRFLLRMAEYQLT